MLVLLITVYAVGSEIKFRTAGEWLQAAGGDITIAVIGKLLPYTLIFSLIGILGNFVMFGILHIPFQGSWLLLNGMTVLFIIATQALALFIFSCFLPWQSSSVSYPWSDRWGLPCPASPSRYSTCIRWCETPLICSRAPLHRDYTNHALLWWRIHPPMAFGSDTLYLPAIGIGDAPHLRRAIISRKYENIR